MFCRYKSNYSKIYEEKQRTRIAIISFMRMRLQLTTNSGLNNKNLFPHSSEDPKSKSVSLGWNQDAGRAALPPEALGENFFFASSSFWWQLALPGLWPHHSYLQGQHLQISLCSTFTQPSSLWMVPPLPCEWHLWLHVGSRIMSSSQNP